MEKYVSKKDRSFSTPLYQKSDASSPSIMQSLDSITVMNANSTCEDKNVESYSKIVNEENDTLMKPLKSLNLTSKDDASKSFQIIDNKEYLQVNTKEQFLSKLGISNLDTKVKVLSIFGNTGDGKSYTLNHTFFDKQEVFKTSSSQSPCTSGVWIAYDPKFQILCLDTEGLLTSSNKELQTTRLLLKVLAVSDIVIYKTRSERLPKDMFTFLGSASKAFTHHFHSALQNVGLKDPVYALGPAAIIFHESRHTKPLQKTVSESPEDILKKRFAELNIPIDGFSSLHYIGQQALTKTNFTQLKLLIKEEIVNTEIRLPRNPTVVFETLCALNKKFSGEIGDGKPALFPDEYFTCPSNCLSCGKRCELSVGHVKDGNPHLNSYKCKYKQQYENLVYLCEKCLNNGVQQTAIPVTITDSSSSLFGLAKYVWSGYKIQCPNCGEIYSSRQYWYGNKAPEESRYVKTRIVHIWPESGLLEESQNMAQKVVDRVAYISEAVASVCAQPTKLLSSYVTDQIAPKYWRPNDQIKHCHNCKKWFPPTSKKHHCRSCGEGFCENCSSYYMPVPKYGWNEAVRVCNNCYNAVKNEDSETSVNNDSGIHDMDIRARKYGEVVLNTLSTVANILEYPKEIIKGSARPSYWVPDDEITECCICKAHFGPTLSLHHCRGCGRGVCAKCSPNKQPVPKRNWENPVRVCDDCYQSE